MDGGNEDMGMTDLSIQLRVVLFQESEMMDGSGDELAWVMQCLEYDIATQGTTIEIAKQRFEDTIVGQLRLDALSGRSPLQGIGPAPRVYWDLFRKATKEEKHQPLCVPSAPNNPFETIETTTGVYT